MLNGFRGTATPLSHLAFDRATKDLGVDAASLWALLTVETRGFGFLADRRPKLLFERHIFHKRTSGRFSAEHSDISAAAPGGYKSGAAEYERLGRAMQLDRKAALDSASWGLAQIMGFNAVPLRYVAAEEMIASFLDGEDAHLDGAVRYLSTNPPLRSAFRNRKWTTVAFYYNGKEYAKNHYHVKLQRYYDLYSIKGTPSLEVRAAQARLTYLGFDPRGVDGVLGAGTQAAIIAFQKASSLSVTGDLDSATLQKLNASS
jgi:hypothetical protein